MEQAATRRRRKQNPNNLIILIAVLVIVLAVLVVIALTIPKPEPDPEPSLDTGVPTTQATRPQPTEPPEIAGLTVTEPSLTGILWTEKTITFRGTADPRETLTIGGGTVAVAEDGSFAQEVTLHAGINEIPVVYRGETVTYVIDHCYVLQYITPVAGGEYGNGATVQVSAAIREGASLTVTFNDEIITMKKSDVQLGNNLAEGFVLYTGSCQLPSGHLEDLDLGPVTFVATCDGVTETLSSGSIICQKRTDVLKSDPSVTPEGGNYVDVGSGYIVELLIESAETFLGSDVNRDPSRPNVNYLPKGTVDYGYVEDIQNGTYTIRLRCGRRVYLKRNNFPFVADPMNVDTYIGTLPDHNEIGVAQVKQDEDHTFLILNTLWKAPFYLDLLPQRYADPGSEQFQVSSFTAEYVEITFCYTTEFEGKVAIPEGNPLFSHAEVTQNTSDATLRLYLKEKGQFYGWDACYNDAGQLCFRFVNPKTVKETDANPYGVDLTGVNILLDVGHGGGDPGALAGDYQEADLNLQLAMKLKTELEKMGATVTLNRTDDASITVLERIAHLKEQSPDLCLSVHQNSGTSPSYNGGWICYFTAFSKKAADFILEETTDAGVYKKTQFAWIKNYMSRETVCPVVLLENGFMSNADDLAGMIDERAQLKKAEAVARGVARYFLSISN